MRSVLPSATIIRDAFCYVMGACLALAPVRAVSADSGGSQTYTLAIPAPRGRILDAKGRVLAASTPVRRWMLRVPKLQERETAESFAAWLDQQWPSLLQAAPDLVKPTRAEMAEHFHKRRYQCMPVSGPFYGDGIAAGKAKPEWLEAQTEYGRDYPRAALAAQAIGYARPEGKAGLEAAMNQELAGSAGTMNLRCDRDGRCLERTLIKAPAPGMDLVTTLLIEVQEAAEKALADGGRLGAVVVVNAVTGDILARASAPAFEPRDAADVSNNELLVKLASDPAQPLLDRAAGTVYPPGSLMKPIVALAGLRSGCINPSTFVPCGPDLVIDGFEFHNWTTWERGGFDLHAAITRSCNTYFFQAAIAIGDQAILAALREFGFGQPFPPSLAGSVHATLPGRIPTRGKLADFVIGHGGVAVSPLEAAMAMAALANGEYRPRARWVSEIRDPDGRVVSEIPAAVENRLQFAPEHLARIQQDMYSVVNHRDGTARDAHLDKTRIHGKTGTAQWQTQGAIVNAVWFGGFVKDCDPPLAFAVAIEGKKGERIVGGSAAAPVAGQMLAQIFADPARHGLRATGARAPWEVDIIINADLKPSEKRDSVPTIPASGYSRWFPPPRAAAGLTK